MNTEIEYKLLSINPNSIDTVPNRGMLIKVRIVDIYDGDTFTILYMLDGTCMKTKIRLLGVDTPEIRKKKGCSDLESKAGKKIRDYLRKHMLEKIYYAKLLKHDKYGGRIVGDIYLANPEETEEDVSLSSFLLERKLGKVYDGKKKFPWNTSELDYILSEL